jgi:hypothetical protein
MLGGRWVWKQVQVEEKNMGVEVGAGVLSGRILKKRVVPRPFNQQVGSKFPH